MNVRHMVRSTLVIPSLTSLTILLLSVGSAFAAAASYTSSGNWTAPAGVTSVVVECWGAGGGGGGVTKNTNNNILFYKGGGGAGGQYARKTVTVTPGATYPITVGVGGTASLLNGGAGGDTTFSSLVVAKGGAGGVSSKSGGNGGVGSSAGGAGDVVFPGGTGSGGGPTDIGGAGGGGAGSSGPGASAAGNLPGGATATFGGAGGAGRTTTDGPGTGFPGSIYGGGGGGGFTTTNSDQYGGTGGSGYAQITYNQAITVTSPPPATAGVSSLFTVTAAASSGLPVTYSSGSPGICTNSGGTFTMLVLGTCIVQYDQVGDGSYNAASRITQTVSVVKGTQAAVIVSAPASAVYGSAGLMAVAGGGSGTGSYSYSSGSSTACTVDSSTGALTITSGTGSCSITALRAGDANYDPSVPSAAAVVTVRKAVPTVSAWPGASPVTYGEPLSVSTLSGGTASVAGTFSFEMPGTVPEGGTYTAGVRFSPFASTNYDVVTGSVSVTVNKAWQVIVFNPLSAVTYGAADFGAGATGGPTGNPITYTSANPAVATVTGAGLLHIVGAGTTTITASQAGNGNYSDASPVSQVLTVEKALLTVTADNGSRPYGTVNPPFTASYSGFVNGETAAVLTGAPTFTTTAAMDSPVGSYPIVPAAGTLAAANYTFAFASGTLAVGLASQTITFNPLPVTSYGDVPFALSFSPGASGEPVTFTSSDTSVATVSGSTLTIVGAGSATITASQSGNVNYASASAQQPLTVKKAVLTVSAQNASRIYNAPNPILTYAYGGFVNGEDQTVLSGTPSMETTAVPGSPSGSYPIIVSQGTLAAANYSFTFVNGTLAVGQASQSISFDPLPAMVYGDAPFVLSATGGGSGYPVTFTSSNPAVATVSGSTVTIVGAGTTTITASQAGDANYSPASAEQELTVAKAPLTVAAQDATRSYNSENPAFSFTYSGFVNGDNASVLAGGPLLGTSAGVASPIGTYPIVVSVGNLFSTNYSFNYANGTLTITQAVPVVSAWPAPTFITYGQALSASTLGGGSASVPGAFAFTTPSTTPGAGTYTAGITFTPADAVNYMPVTGTVDVVVARATPSVTMWPAASPIVYGETLELSTLTGGAATPAGSFAFTAAATMPPAGTASQSVTYTPADTANYTTVSGMVSVTVARATPTITAWPAATPIGYGQSLASSSLTGGSASVPGTFAFAASSTTPPVGIFSADVVFVPADGADYTAVAGTVAVTVNKAAQAAVAVSAPASAIFGQTGLVATASGGTGTGAYAYSCGSSTACTVDSLTGALSFTSGTGDCAITAIREGDANYSASAPSVPALIAVGKQSQLVTFSTLPSMTYGAADFGPGATGGGSGNPVAYVSSDPAVATITAGGLIHIVGSGSTTITASQAGNDNYGAAAPVSQLLTVEKAVLTVTADNASRLFGVENPAFTASYSGFVNGETVMVLSGAPLFTTTATIGSPVGSYPIVASQGSLAAVNYSFTFATGTLAVGLASQTITFNPLPVKTYGDGPFPVTYTPGASGQPVTFTSSNPAVATVSGSTVTIVGAGTAVLTAYEEGDANYASATAQQTLTVKKAVITVTAENASRPFNSANPLLTASYGGFVNGDTLAVLSGGPVLETTAVPVSPVGSYPITVTQGSLTAANYGFAFVNGTLAVGQASQTISFGPLDGKTYGTAPFDLSAAGGASGNPVTFASSNPAVATVSGSTVTVVGAGNTTITAIQAGDANYAPATAQQELVVAKAELTVTARDAERAYGTANPTFTVTYSGFVNGDTASAISGSATMATSAVTGSPVGTYPITSTIGNLFSTNYSFVFGNGTLTVSKATPVITWPVPATTTEGTPLSATQLNATAPVPGTFSYTPAGGAVLPLGPQTLTADFTPSDTTNYTTASRSVTITVVPKTPATVTLGSLNQTYDGSTRRATATTIPAGLTVTFTYDGSPAAPVNVGSYTVVATISDVTYAGSATGTLVIGKGTASVILGSLSQTYDGTVKTVTATTIPAGKTVTFTYDGAATPPVEVGSYAVVGTVNDASYQGSATGTLVIGKGTATVTLGSLSQVYDGTPRSATATTNPAGKAVSFTYNGSATAPTVAGSYTVVGTINDPSYQGSASGILVIGKATATVTLASLAHIYDGASKTATATTLPEGKAVSFTYNGSPSAPTAAGSYTVVGTITDVNYLGSETGTLVIAKAAGSLTLGNLDQTYNGTPRSATATTVPAGRTVTFTYNGSPVAPTSAGSYTVVGTISDVNYEGSATGILVVGKGSATVTLGGLMQTYDGTPRPASATTIPPGRTVTFTYDGSAAPPVDTGSYAVMGTISDPNYTGSATGTLVIGKATASVALGSLTQTFDGTPKAVTATSYPSGKTVTFTYDGSTAPPSAVGSYTVVGTVNDGNYLGSATGTLVITKAIATVTLDSLSHTYDGSAKNATASTDPADKSVTITYNGSTTAPRVAGSYAVVATVNDPNYQGSATGILVIAKATATITLANLSHPYDGLAKTATATTSPAGKTVVITYNGSSTAPSIPGNYSVVGTISDANYQGGASGTLTIAGPTATAGQPTGTFAGIKSGNTFSILRSEAGNPFITIATGIAATTYTDTSSLKSNTVYQYAVTSDTDGTRTVFMTIRTALCNGWNIIAVPYTTTGINTSTFFGSQVSAVYEWTPSGTSAESSDTVLGSYGTVTSLVPGKGYFVKTSTGSTALSYSGIPGPASTTITLKPGWTMVSLLQAVNKTDISLNWQIDGASLGVAIISGKIGGGIYWWNGSAYDSWSIIGENPQLEPWKGYWILNLDTVNHTLTIK